MKHVWHLTDHEIWPELRPFVRVDRTRKPGPCRLEVKRPENASLTARFLAVQILCAAGQHVINPVRTRPDGTMRIAVACPHEVNEGCSKGSAASAEVERIASAVENEQVVVDEEQGSLFG